MAGIAAAAVAVLGGGCGSDDEPEGTRSAPPASAAPSELRLPRTPGTDAGRNLVAASGCLGCHRIGSTGNGGPGPDLTHIGDRLRPPALGRALVDPVAPMPSFEAIPAPKRAQIVQYLASLR